LLSVERKVTKKPAPARAIVDSDDEEWDGNEKSLAKDDDVDTSQDESEYSGSGSDEDDDCSDGFIVDSDESDDDYKSSKKRKLTTKTASKKPPLPGKKKPAPTAGNAHSLSKPKSSYADSSPCTSVSSTPMSARSVSPSTPSSALSKLGSFARRADSVGSSNDGDNDMNNSFSSTSGSPAMAHHMLLPEGVVGLGSHEHNSWDFLKPAHRKDKNGRRPDHPDYNPRTLVSRMPLFVSS
jgi:DNA mismatch repair protein MSH6